MYISTVKLKNGTTVVRLMQSLRIKESGSVKKITLKVIGQSKDPKNIELFQKQALTIKEQYDQGLISFDKLDLLKSEKFYQYLGLTHKNIGFEKAFGKIFDNLEFSKLLKSGRNNQALNEVMKQIVLMRIYDPCSKLRSCKLLKERFLKEISYKQILVMMDHITNNLEELKQDVFSSLKGDQKKLDILLFDVTTLYFESVESDNLRNFGFSKDGKFKEVQVVLAVLSDHRGIPLCYEVFPGNTSEIKTFTSVLTRFTEQHALEKLCVVADRGMFSNKNLLFIEQLAQKLNITTEYIVSCPLKKLTKSHKQTIFQFKNRVAKSKNKVADDQHDNASCNPDFLTDVSFCEVEYNGRKIIVSYSEKRRAKDARTREELLAKLNEMTNNKGEIPSNMLRKNRGIAQFTKEADEAKERRNSIIDHDKILSDQQWDGLYGICTNKAESPAKIFDGYKHLWKIEELFRVNKHTLSMRPIYHWTEDRIRTHIFLCFLSYVTLRVTEHTLKEGGVALSHQEIKDTLMNVNLYILEHKINGPADCYCFPSKLSENAMKIYSVLDIKHPIRAFKTDLTYKKTG